MSQKVLIVDDDDMTIMYLKYFLKQEDSNLKQQKMGIEKLK